MGVKLLSAEIQQSGASGIWGRTRKSVLSKQAILGYLPDDIKKEMKRTKQTVRLTATHPTQLWSLFFVYPCFWILICRRAIFASKKVQTFVAVKNHVNYPFTWHVALHRAAKIDSPASSSRIANRIFESMSQLIFINQMMCALFVMTKWVNIIPSIQSNHRVAVKTPGIIKNA